MTGRLSSLRRRRGAAPDTAEAGAPSDKATGAHDPLSAEAPAAPEPAAAPSPLPADVAPGTQPTTGFRDRGRYRRRLRYLRRVRELGFRDLGGLVFDLHRFGRTGDELVHAKLVALDTVDRELRALERVLGDERAFTDLREPGVAACARCGALHGTDARFCPSCGISLGGPAAIGEVPFAAATATATPPQADPQPPAVASPILPLPLPEPDPEPGPEPVAAADPASPPTDGAGDEPPSTPATAAALGLPAPAPPPVPPLPPAAGGDEPTAVLPRVDADPDPR